MSRQFNKGFSFTPATIATANLSTLHSQASIDNALNIIAVQNPGLLLDSGAVERRRRVRNELPSRISKSQLKTTILQQQLHDALAVELVDQQLSEIHRAQVTLDSVQSLFEPPKKRARQNQKEEEEQEEE